MEVFKLYSIVWSKSNVGFVTKKEEVRGTIDDYSSVVSITGSDAMYKEDKVSIKDNRSAYYITRSSISDNDAFNIIKNAMINKFRQDLLEAQECIDELGKLN